MSNAGAVLHIGHPLCAEPSTVGLSQVQLLCLTHRNELCRLREVQAKVCDMLPHYWAVLMLQHT